MCDSPSLRPCRPEQRLSDDDSLAVEGDGGAFIQFVAKTDRFAHTVAERGVVRPGQDSVDGQSVWWRAHEVKDARRTRSPGQSLSARSDQPFRYDRAARWPPPPIGRVNSPAFPRCAHGPRKANFPAEVKRRYDLVGFDLRGAGQSTPTPLATGGTAARRSATRPGIRCTATSGRHHTLCVLAAGQRAADQDRQHGRCADHAERVVLPDAPLFRPGHAGQKSQPSHVSRPHTSELPANALRL
ncbi:hypothetical protein BX283_0709 [Streptomyces sp. TLI_146]|nr:hypothetical protein BX283_0709 [Streptomyces sp. TLI_146]